MEVQERHGYTCWVLDEQQREQLLSQFPAEYQTVIAHHITLDYGVPESSPLPPHVTARLMGEIIDKGVQAFVVEINGRTIRPDGERFHITWSLDEGRYPENAKTLTRRGFWPLPEPIELQVTPAFFESNLK